MNEVYNAYSDMDAHREDAIRVYGEVKETFLDSEIFKAVIKDVETDLFVRFRNGSKDDARDVYYEIQGLKRVINKIEAVVSEYQRLTQLKEDSGKYDDII